MYVIELDLEVEASEGDEDAVASAIEELEASDNIGAAAALATLLDLGAVTTVTPLLIAEHDLDE